MAWKCGAATNKGLVENLKHAQLMSKTPVYEAMLATDRKHYVGTSNSYPYEDSPQPIGYGATISAPHMHAMCLDNLCDHIVKPSSRVLDVGCGSGYLCAVMRRMQKLSGTGEGSVVVGVDYIEPLVELSRENLGKDDAKLQEEIKFIARDGWQGVPEDGPFDAIHVGAAAKEIPEALVEQLVPGGRMIIPVGPQDGDQYLLQVDKTEEGEIETKRLTGVRYVPLVQTKGGK